MVDAVSNATRKAPQAVRMRRNERTGKIRYWNNTLVGADGCQTVCFQTCGDRGALILTQRTSRKPFQVSIVSRKHIDVCRKIRWPPGIAQGYDDRVNYERLPTLSEKLPVK